MINYEKNYNSIFLVSSLSCTSSKDKFIKSPFSNLDTLSTNDWWNRDNNPIINLKVERDQVIAFGIYTVSKNVLKLTAQLFLYILMKVEK